MPANGLESDGAKPPAGTVFCITPNIWITELLQGVEHQKPENSILKEPLMQKGFPWRYGFMLS